MAHEEIKIKIRRSQVNAFQNKCGFRVGHGYNVRENAKIEKKGIYRIYSIKRPECLFNLGTFRVGAYSRTGAY